MSFCVKTDVNYDKILREKHATVSPSVGELGYSKMYFLCFPVFPKASTHRTGIHFTMVLANGEQGVSVWPAVCAGFAYMGSQLAFEGLGQTWAQLISLSLIAIW